MAEAAEAIAGYVARGRSSFDGDPAIRDAILYQIIVLGEAAKAALAAHSGSLPSGKVSTSVKRRSPSA